MTADRLRAWEKRYGVVEPGRSEGGRRLYSDEDIELLRLLHRAVLGGRRISRVAGLSVSELRELVKEDEEEEARRPTGVPGDGAESDPQVYLEEALEAVAGLDAERLDAVLGRARVNLSAQRLIEEVAAPLMKAVGDRWCDGDLTPAHEHLASQVVRNLFGEMIKASPPIPDSPALVVGTPAGNLHEFGALFVTATAASSGWRVVYLGPDLPAEHFARTVHEKGAAAAALSLVYPLSDPDVEEQLRIVRKELPEDVPLIVGGSAADSYKSVLREIRARTPNGLGGLRQELAALT